MDLGYHIRSLHEPYKSGKVDADAKVILEHIRGIKNSSTTELNVEICIDEYINVLEQYLGTSSVKLREALAYASDYLSDELTKLKVL
ncbi:hypothetical protein [Salmonella enterica]|uniref:hypothetical protein n=1 Tax=Salmonella enterica TaxID=28901 RepID=UPI0009AF21D7|nr:hypothetical protein [Salmonella enterica]